jgi:hypothetical protein
VTDLPVHEVDGAGYAAYEVPSGERAWTSELMVGDRMVEGSQVTREVPRR